MSVLFPPALSSNLFFSVIVSIVACLCSAAGRGVGGRGHGVGEKGREETEAGGMQ